jgi:hypothetical protein
MVPPRGGFSCSTNPRIRLLSGECRRRRPGVLGPGDEVAFHCRAVHGAPANDSPATERVFPHRWAGEDVRFVRRGAAGSPPYPHLKLADGAPFDAPDFPVVYRR